MISVTRAEDLVGVPHVDEAVEMAEGFEQMRREGAFVVEVPEPPRPKYTLKYRCSQCGADCGEGVAMDEGSLQLRESQATWEVSCLVCSHSTLVRPRPRIEVEVFEVTT